MQPNPTPVSIAVTLPGPDPAGIGRAAEEEATSTHPRQSRCAHLQRLLRVPRPRLRSGYRW